VVQNIMAVKYRTPSPIHLKVGHSEYYGCETLTLLVSMEDGVQYMTAFMELIPEGNTPQPGQRNSHTPSDVT
jgi:hypothetical protein